jgi:hypothetical protein
MALWRHRAKGSLPVTHHGRMEIVNAISLAVFRKEITSEHGSLAWASLDQDFAHGHLTQVDILWRAALNRAGELSRTHSVHLGTRALDVLHVACALELSLPVFLSFDERQLQLAKAAGLKLVRL